MLSVFARNVVMRRMTLFCYFLRNNWKTPFEMFTLYKSGFVAVSGSLAGGRYVSISCVYNLVPLLRSTACRGQSLLIAWRPVIRTKQLQFQVAMQI